MRIIVLGIGGVGGYFGGRLANTDCTVEFVARGEHGKVIAEKGLQVKSIYGNFHARPARVHHSVATVEHPDLVLLCTKSWQLGEVASQLKARITPDTLVLPLQNGVDNTRKVAEFIPEEQVLGGLCKIISRIEAPGVIDHFAFHPQIIFGSVNGHAEERLGALQSLFANAGIDAVLSEDIQVEIWRKFLFICVISGMGALTRQEIGVMREDPFIRNLMTDSAYEILALAGKKGIALTEKDIEQVFKAIDKQEYHSTASMQRDMMNGRPSELHDFNGYVVREAETYDLKVPVNSFIYYTLRPMEEQARKQYE